MKVDRYREIAHHYDNRLAEFGDTAKGADWPNQEDRERRFDVMLDLLRDDKSPSIDLLDFACGSGDLLRHIAAQNLDRVSYQGADISSQAIDLAREKFPGSRFTCLDIMQASDEEVAALEADYCIVNGLFTVKADLTEGEMWTFLGAVVRRLWSIARKGIAFNVMSKQVDWERADLFHASMDRMAELLHELAGRNVCFRADYGLYEYTCFAYKEPRHLREAVAPAPRSGTDVVCKPLLPSADQVAPYMRAIDQQRWYSNWGPLSQRLEERFAGHFGLGERSCIPASSGTDALVGALIAAAGRGRSDKPYCFMPSYTFVATAAAALNAGYEPYFVDVDEETFALSPQAFMQHPEVLRAGAIMVVAPYGRAVDVGAWAEVSERTGVPVVVDAAAGFDAIASGYMKPVGRVPVVASFHATKVFGIGEGGAILCGNGDLAERCRRALNFGFLGDRIATITGINGKMSEYQAAVALAEFDAWPQKRNAFLRVARRYLDAASRHGLTDRLVAEDAWASSYVLYRAPTMTEAGLVTRKLGEAKIDHRLWYGAGLHRQHAYANFSADPLPVTESLAPRLIGLPMSIDIGDQDIERVVATLASARSSS